MAEDDDKDDDDGGDDGDDEEDDDDDNDNDDFDLESALAQLDQDSIVAVVEGAQEDLLLEPGEDSVPVPAETVAVAGAEGVGAGEAERDEGAEEQVEEADGISQDDQNWALVETEEIVEVVATAVEVEERAGGAAGMVVPEGGRGAGEGAGEEGEVAEVGDEPGPSAATLAVPEADEINTRREDEHGGSADLTVIAEAEPVVQETIEQVSAAADRVAQDITSATAASAEPAGMYIPASTPFSPSESDTFVYFPRSRRARRPRSRCGAFGRCDRLRRGVRTGCGRGPDGYSRCRQRCRRRWRRRGRHREWPRTGCSAAEPETESQL